MIGHQFLEPSRDSSKHARRPYGGDQRRLRLCASSPRDAGHSWTRNVAIQTPHGSWIHLTARGSRMLAGWPRRTRLRPPAIAVAVSGGLGAAWAAALAIHRPMSGHPGGLTGAIGRHSAHWDRQPQSLRMAWSSSFSWVAVVRVVDGQPQSLRMAVPFCWWWAGSVGVSPSRCAWRFLSAGGGRGRLVSAPVAAHFGTSLLRFPLTAGGS
jgi:hypothetical protein